LRPPANPRVLGFALLGGRNVVGWRPLGAIIIPKHLFVARPGLRPSGADEEKMAETASLKVYLIREDVTIEQIEEFIIGEHGYEEFIAKGDIQERYSILLNFYFKHTNNLPLWYEFIKGYFIRGKEFRFESYSFIGIFTDIESGSRYFFCGGGGAYIIPRFIKFSFGIEILEKIFDEDKNKLEKVNDRQIIGDILASSRYYRRGRSLAYEDDFGKYFQTINIKIEQDQIRTFFPSIAEFKGDKLAKQITIVGSSSLEISSRINFLVFISLLKDVSKILSQERVLVFNKSLLPVNTKTSKSLILSLEVGLIDLLIQYAKGKGELDIDFCHVNFDDFYSSSMFVIAIPELIIIPNIPFNGYTFDSIDPIRDYRIFVDLYKEIQNTREFRSAAKKDEFIFDIFKNIKITTYDDNGILKTTGNIIDYIQAEYTVRGNSYFLLDTIWYEIQSLFDENLNDRYIKRIKDNVKDFAFIPAWPKGNDEDYFNSQFASIPNALFLHKVKVENIELCDSLYYTGDTLYIIHAKDDISATIRDLTSQATISSRIIEEESIGDKQLNIEKLYKSGVDQKRIDPKKMTKNQFIRLFRELKREYILVIRSNTYSKKQIEDGEFKSRIAKFSLYEYSAFMHTNDYIYYIVIR
jgi:hypothetical protein